MPLPCPPWKTHFLGAHKRRCAIFDLVNSNHTMENNTVSTSLLTFLGRRNPRIRYRSDPDAALGSELVKSNTKNNSYISPSFILEWKEFDFSALEKMYSGRLQKILRAEPGFRVTMPSSCEEKEVWHETSFEWRILAKWNQEVVQEALMQSSEELGLGAVSMERGWAADSLKGFKPDWAGVQDPNSWNILPGESKYHSTFDSSHVKKNCSGGKIEPKHTGKPWFQPWKQIFTYCVRGFCRYGYIITDHELCVVRVSVLANQSSSRPDSQQLNSQKTVFSDMDPNDTQLIKDVEAAGLIQYKSISWNTSSETENSEKVVTVNLALWWLHIIAAMNGRLDWDYIPLSEECIFDSKEDMSVGLQESTFLMGQENEANMPQSVTAQLNANRAKENPSFVSTLGIPTLAISSLPTEVEFVAKSGKKRERGKGNELQLKSKKKKK
jgi:hypothetical protein